MRKKQKFIIGIIFTLLAIVVLVFLVVDKEKNYTISDYTVNYLKECGISNYEIKEIPYYKSKKLVEKPVKISDEQVQEYIDTIVESYAYMQPVTDRTEVEEGDFVYVSYAVFSAGECMKEVSGDVLKVGSGYYDREFEELLPGAVVGKSFDKSIYSEENKQEQNYKVTVDSIQEYVTYELNDQFAQEKLNVSTAKEYYNLAEEKLLNEERAIVRQQAENELLEDLIVNSKIQFSEEEIATYAKQIVEKYNQLAYISQMNLQEYYTQKLKLNEQEFYEKCYNEAKSEVSKDVIIGVIAEQENIVVSEQEIQDYLQQEDENADEIDIAQYILQSKVMNLFERK